MATDDLEAMEASFRRRKRLARVLYAAVIAAPFLIVGYCVKQSFFRHEEPPHEVTLSADEQRAVREVVQARSRALGQSTAFRAPAAILEQLRSAQPSDAPCARRLQTRGPISPGYEPPEFELTQISTAELASATPADVVPGGDDTEVVFVTEYRAEGISNGVDFVPGEVRGRAFLWSHSAGRIVCAGDIHAASSPSIGVTRTTIGGAPVISTGGEDRNALIADLDRQLERAVAAGLHAVH